jgi:hypothetical protein
MTQLDEDCDLHTLCILIGRFSQFGTLAIHRILEISVQAMSHSTTHFDAFFVAFYIANAECDCASDDHVDQDLDFKCS